MVSVSHWGMIEWPYMVGEFFAVYSDAEAEFLSGRERY